MQRSAPSTTNTCNSKARLQFNNHFSNLNIGGNSHTCQIQLRKSLGHFKRANQKNIDCMQYGTMNKHLKIQYKEASIVGICLGAVISNFFRTVCSSISQKQQQQDSGHFRNFFWPFFETEKTERQHCLWQVQRVLPVET